MTQVHLGQQATETAKDASSKLLVSPGQTFSGIAQQCAYAIPLEKGLAMRDYQTAYAVLI